MVQCTRSLLHEAFFFVVHAFVLIIVMVSLMEVQGFVLGTGIVPNCVPSGLTSMGKVEVTYIG